jgi:2',3'-cyclic-nucleotide 2'-phosphodiesterase (5'-nucleotidase family)
LLITSRAGYYLAPMRRTAVVGVVTAACLAACTVDKPQPNLVGQDVRLTIIHTADIHSRLFPYHFVPNKFDQDYGLLPGAGPYGGMAKIATMVKRIRKSSDRSLWLDSGDAWEGAPVFNEFKGEVEIRALSLAGLDGEVLGNHEFDLGSTQLFQQIDQWSQFPHLVANYAFDDPPDPKSRSLRDVVQPFEIYDVQGVRVGVIGMGNQDTLLSSFEGGNSLGFRPIENTMILKQYVAMLRPVCDLVVVVSHLGLDTDEGLSSSQIDDPNEALAVQGVDLVLGGHLHIVTNPPKLLPNGDTANYCNTHDCRTVLVHSGAFAKYVGRLDLVVHVGTDNNDPENRSRIVSFAYNNQPVASFPVGDPNYTPDDPDIANLLWPYSIKLNQDINLSGVFAYINPPGTAKIVRNDPSGGDSQLGNLVARAMQQQQGVEAQFAFTNSLGIRADFERGPLDNEDMYNVFPFENTIVVMYLSGQEVKDTLDFVSAKSATRGCQTQVQVAGITYDQICRDDPTATDTCDEVGLGDKPCRCNVVDPNEADVKCNADVDCNPADPTTTVSAVNDRCDTTTHSCVQTACSANIYIGDACRPVDSTGVVQTGTAVDPVHTKCVPLEINGLYRVAVNNYIAAGGSGFFVLKRNTSQQDTGVSLRDALTVFLTKQPPVCDGVDDKNIMDANGKTVFADYGEIACLDETLEAHDGRIRPVSR